MDIIIKEATENDLQDMITLYFQPDMDNGEVIALETARQKLVKTKQYPYYKVFIALLDGKTVGTFELLIMDNFAHQGRPSGIIEDVVVAEAYQGRGIGKEMMRFAVERCKEQGCYKVALSSNLKRAKAHLFYESLGFKRHGYSFLLEISSS